MEKKTKNKISLYEVTKQYQLSIVLTELANGSLPIRALGDLIECDK